MRRSARDSGQALVEFTIVLPVFLFLLLAMMEFGFAFSDRLTLGNATREGARVGASLVTGSTTSCTGDPNGVDNSIVASLQFILKSGGSDVDLSHINSIKIFEASSTGAPVTGSVNTWTYTPGAGPTVGTDRLDFSPSSTGWAACLRSNRTPSPDSIGVSIDYQYQLKTPLSAVASLLRFTQAPSIDIVDTTVMSLNPTS